MAKPTRSLEAWAVNFRASGLSRSGGLTASSPLRLAARRWSFHGRLRDVTQVACQSSLQCEYGLFHSVRVDDLQGFLSGFALHVLPSCLGEQFHWGDNDVE